MSISEIWLLIREADEEGFGVTKGVAALWIVELSGVWNPTLEAGCGFNAFESGELTPVGAKFFPKLPWYPPCGVEG